MACIGSSKVVIKLTNGKSLALPKIGGFEFDRRVPQHKPFPFAQRNATQSNLHEAFGLAVVYGVEGLCACA